MAICKCNQRNEIACEALNTPVTGGNVSFYNQTVLKEATEPVFPTPTIGMIGLVPDKNNIMTLGFKQKGDLIYLLGDCYDISSEYLANYLNIDESPTPFLVLMKNLNYKHYIN